MSDDLDPIELEAYVMESGHIGVRDASTKRPLPHQSLEIDDSPLGILEAYLTITLKTKGTDRDE